MEQTFIIGKLENGQERTAAELAVKMWDSHTVEELEEEFWELVNSENAAVFAAYDGKKPIGFAQCQLRSDYVEGTSASPVGYLEGIFVEEKYRKQRAASQLLKACEEWSRAKGCAEFASDCELTNDLSLQFHLSTGFEEANRIICFTKKL